ncbi:GIN domain-containing protein [Oxalobacteraceae bacterium A2-2]
MRRALLSVLLPALAAATLSASAHAAESERKLPSFIAVNTKGALYLRIEVGQAQSVKVSGDDGQVADLRTEVVDNELNITLPDKKYPSSSKTVRVVVTMPSLARLKMMGAGETVLNKVSGERLDISYLGAGHLEADGSVKYLRLAAKGVGEVDTRKLKAERVDVNFEGVGAVSVYASDTLNAVAKGMGSLEYYGKPKHVNKSVAGIGSVSAGD